MKPHVLLRPVALGAHLFAVFCVGLAIFLGFWQVGAWQGHRDDAAAKEAAALVEQEPVEMTSIFGPDDPFMQANVGKRVMLDATWMPETTLYVQEREREGATGYWVVTSALVAGEESAIPLVRGWIPTLDSRPPVPEGESSLVGWLQPPEGAAGMVDEDRNDDVVPQMRMADLVQHTDADLYGGYVIIDHEAGQENDGTEGTASVSTDHVPEVSATTGWRNLLYGVEWWIFSGFALFIWIRWCRDEVLRDRAERNGETAGDTAPEGEPASDEADVHAEA